MVITPEAASDIEDLPLTIRVRVLAIVERLAHWPSVTGAKPLRGKLKGRYRIRTGDYRVQFYPSGKTLLIVERVGHRDGFSDD